MPGLMRLCRLDEIADGDAKGFETANPDEPDFFVVRDGETVHGYLNDCPHWNAPLDFVPGRFMNREKGLIQCANHGARFRIETGECVFGPCLGEALTRVPVTVVDGEVWLAAARLERAPAGRWRVNPGRP
jgi:nitrite reductase/ring-hydroxylating ferredoxin subunit